jgi:hypothetical protein
MRTLAGILTALVFAASLSARAVAKSHHENGHSMMAPGHMKRSCGPGHHWVNGYRKKSGQMVKGYCR